MELTSSLDWIFMVLTLACVIFLFQILVEYNRQAGQLRPQLRQVAEIRQRHEQEMERVARLTEEAEEDGAELDKQVLELDARAQLLEAELNGLQAQEES